MIDNTAEHREYVEDVFGDGRKQTCALRFKVEPTGNPMEKFKGVGFCVSCSST